MRKPTPVLVVVVLALGCAMVLGADETARDIDELSLDSLLSVRVSAASKYEQTVSEAPASVTIITAEEIERYGYETLAEVLRGVAGFYTSNDRNYIYLGTRGFSRPTDYNNRILLLINGHVTNENVFGSAAIGTDLPIDLRAVERIEIVKGPGSALYGTGAMFAVINVVTRTDHGARGLQVDLAAGSFGEHMAAARYGRELGDDGHFLLSAMTRHISGQDLYMAEYDTPQTNHGIAEDLDWDDSYGLLATASIGDLSLLARFLCREKGIPTGAFGVQFNNPSARSLDKQGGLELRFDRDLGATRGVMLRAYYDVYGYRGSYPYQLDYLESADGQWAGAEAQLRWDLNPGHRFTIGLEYQHHLKAEYRTWDAEQVFFDGDYPFRVWSLYAQDELQLTENLAATLGFRYDYHSQLDGSLNPRAALVYHPYPSTTVKLLLGQAFRAPNLYEARFEDPGIQKPNPYLDRESIRTAEIAWDQRIAENLLASLSLYRYTMDDLIDPEVDPSDDLLVYRNVSKVETRGFELSITGRFASSLHCYLSYSRQHADSPGTARPLSNSPERLAKLGLSTRLGPRGHVAAELLHESGRWTVQGTTTDSYTLARLHLGLHPSRRPLPPVRQGPLDRWGVSLTVDNPFDQEYSTPGGYEHRQDAIVQDGRRYSLKLEYRF